MKNKKCKCQQLKYAIQYVSKRREGTYEDFKQAFSDKIIDTLHNSGIIVMRNLTWEITPKGSKLAKLFKGKKNLNDIIDCILTLAA